MTKHQTDQFGRHTYKNYSIEPWHVQGVLPARVVESWSIYNRFNSMYDNKDGFKSIEEAVQYIDNHR